MHDCRAVRFICTTKVWGECSEYKKHDDGSPRCIFNISGDDCLYTTRIPVVQVIETLLDHLVAKGLTNSGRNCTCYRGAVAPGCQGPFADCTVSK